MPALARIRSALFLLGEGMISVLQSERISRWLCARKNLRNALLLWE